MTIELDTTATNVDMTCGYPKVTWTVDITTATNFKHALADIRKIGTYSAYDELWTVMETGRVEGDKAIIAGNVTTNSLRALGATFTAPATDEDTNN